MGFLLGGVGEINKNRHPNFMVVDKSKRLILIGRFILLYCSESSLTNNILLKSKIVNRLGQVIC